MLRLFAFCLFACLVLAQNAVGQERVAFIVGNSVYDHAPPLANPGNDAHLIARTLRGLDFEVALHENMTRWQIAGELADFLERTEGADLTLFYFAGHGMQFEGKNYLLGSDARLRTELDVEAETLALDQIIRLLRRNSRAALVFVDACRDNPIADSFFRANFSATRALTMRGLAPTRAAFDGAMVTFAASPGQVAYDGDGVHSPFAAALAKHLPSPNIEILTLMKRVSRDVRDATEERQIPVVNNDLTREIFLRQAPFGSAARSESQSETAPLPESDVTASLATDAIRDTLSRTLSPEDAETALDLSKEERRNAQSLLRELGYDPGPIDGVLGQRSRTALAQFQLEHGLIDTGYLEDKTIKAMLDILDKAPRSRDGIWRLTLNRRVLGDRASDGMVGVMGFVELEISGRRVTVLEERNLSMASQPAVMATRARLLRDGNLQVSVTLNAYPHQNTTRRIAVSVDLPERVLVGQALELTKRDLGSGFILEPKLRRKSSSK